MSTEYIPGTCNIGAGEVKRRQFVAAIGFLLFITSSISLFGIDAPRSARLGLFFPLMVATIGWVQSRKKFCLAYDLWVHSILENSGNFHGYLTKLHSAQIARRQFRYWCKHLSMPLQEQW